MATPQIAEVVYRLNTLLHTMRAIARHEDQICALMTEIQSSARVDQTTDVELRDLLEQMPSHEYLDDVDAVRESLTPALLTPTKPTRKPTSKPKRPAKPPAKRAKR